MSKLKKERLNQMIENALSHKQEIKKHESHYFCKLIKGLGVKSNFYGITFASFIIACVFLPRILIQRNIVNINEINDFLTYEIIEDL